MNKADQTDFSRPGSVRLYDSHWRKLRAVMQAKGRRWLEKAIDREYKKITEEKQT